MSSHSARHGLWMLGCLATVALAQPPPADSTPGIEARRTSPLSSGGPTRRTSSHETAAALAGIKFDAPEAKKEEEKPAEDVDLREVDKPRNGIVRLPKFIVEGERPPVFSDREINTKKGMADVAVKRYLSTVHQGLNKYHLPSILGGLSSEDVAMQMYRDDERLKNSQEMNEKISLFRDVGAKETDALQKDATSTYRPPSQFSDTTSKIPRSGARILRDGEW